MKHFHLLAALLLMAFAVPVTGCGGDDKPAATRGVKRSKTSAKKGKKGKGAKVSGSAKTGVDLSKLPPKLRNVDWGATDDLATAMRETRDPFAPYVEDLLVDETSDEGAEGGAPKIKSAIADTPVEALQLIAIITGGAVHKAMVTDSRGLGHIVRPGEIVGMEPPMRVVRITRNEIMFRALEVGPDEEKPKEVRKVLLSQEELQELLP